MLKKPHFDVPVVSMVVEFYSLLYFTLQWSIKKYVKWKEESTKFEKEGISSVTSIKQIQQQASQNILTLHKCI